VQEGVWGVQEGSLVSAWEREGTLRHVLKYTWQEVSDESKVQGVTGRSDWQTSTRNKSVGREHDGERRPSERSDDWVYGTRACDEYS
jgi:hypothetical protein